MSKVNVDEIQVGDLVGFEGYKGEILIGYVTNIETKQGCKQFWGHFSSSHNPDRIEFLHDFSVDYHWKVINFEEETKMDELKVYTGKETLQALLEGKTLKSKEYNTEYKMIDEMLHSRKTSDWNRTVLSFNLIYEMEFTEVAVPQVGDWVRAHFKDDIYIGQLKRIEDNYQMWAVWNKNGTTRVNTWLSTSNDWEILSPEQVSEYKREQAFIKVGRKPNEFRSGDIVMIDNEGVIGVVVSNKNTGEVKVNEFNKALQGWNTKPHQLTPIAFTEQQVDLS